jgi:hypothetical protein
VQLTCWLARRPRRKPKSIGRRESGVTAGAWNSLEEIEIEFLIGPTTVTCDVYCLMHAAMRGGLSCSGATFEGEPAFRGKRGTG